MSQRPWRPRARRSAHAAARNACAVSRRAGAQRRATPGVRGGRCALGSGAAGRRRRRSLAGDRRLKSAARTDELRRPRSGARRDRRTGARSSNGDTHGGRRRRQNQTALRVATELNEAGQRDVCFVALAPIAILVGRGSDRIDAGRQEVPNRPLLETLITYLKNKPMLLILDNCEHVIAEAASLPTRFLIGCPRVRILATSRESLRAAGEYTYRLPRSASVARGADGIRARTPRRTERSALSRSRLRRQPSFRAHR